VTDYADLLNAIGFLVTALVSAWNALQLRKNSRLIEQVHVATNSMKDELVRATRREALIEGAAAGRLERDNAGTGLP